MIFNQKHPCALGDLEHSFSALHWFVRFRDSIRTSCFADGVQVQPILRPEHFPFVHRIQPATKRKLERAVQKMHNGAMMAELLANSRLSPTKREGRRMQEQQKHILFHSERQ